jgi:fructuronate reductase
MVDRLVPATTETDRTRIAGKAGVTDAWPVVCEPFTQWVIEDHFPQGRPAWERTGATLVDDVRPYETMKLRLLNGSHSAIAYRPARGPRDGRRAMKEPATPIVTQLMAEAATTLHMPSSVDLEAYRQALIDRFRNPALQHRTAQIAMDGSQKLPMRIFATAQIASPMVSRRSAWRS